MQIQGAITKEARLFNKNLAFRKSEKISMEGDVCPVPVPQTSLQWSQRLVNGGNNYNSLKLELLRSIIIIGPLEGR